MAPEQFGGAACDARTDQFSFCVALYEALYGHRPFEGETPVALLANVLAGTVKEAPRRRACAGLDPQDPAARAEPDARRALPRRWRSCSRRSPTIPPRPGGAKLAMATGLALMAAAAFGAQRLNPAGARVCAGGAERVARALGPEPARRGGARVHGDRKPARSHRPGERLTTLLDRYAARWADMYTEACEATQVRGEQSAEVLDLRMECLNQRLSSVSRAHRRTRRRPTGHRRQRRQRGQRRSPPSTAAPTSPCCAR